MAKKYDGYIAKDKNGDYWYETFGVQKKDVESHIKEGWSKIHRFTIVKIKFVEVNDG